MMYLEIQKSFNVMRSMRDMTKPEHEMSLRELQEKHRPWSKHNFDSVYPDGNWWKPLLGVMEELGELAHSCLKQSEGIRGSYEKHDAKAKDAVGDIVIFLCAFCSKRGWDLQELVEAAWNEIKDRDFKKFPVNGVTE